MILTIVTSAMRFRQETTCERRREGGLRSFIITVKATFLFVFRG